MGLDEWVLRTLFALLIINLFVGGLYVFIRGYFTQYMLKRFWLHKTATMERGKGLHASVSWRYRGEEIHAVEPYLFTLRNKERIYVYVSPYGYDFKLDAWNTNGKGMMLGGIILQASSLFLFFLLIA